MFYDIDKCDIVSSADDNTQYTSYFSIEKIIQKLELISNNLIKWFENNHMKVNTGQATKIPSSLSKVMFFHFPKSQIQKLNVLARVINFMNLAKRKESNENIYNIPG